MGRGGRSCLTTQPPPSEAEAAALRPDDLDLARRPGQSAADFSRRALALARARLRDAPPSVSFADLPGMGGAGDWARAAAADLRAYRLGRLPWSEVDRGAVLEGPPGCGKTTLVRALAHEAGAALVASSVQEWQAAREGHLGHLLAAMRECFEEARRRAPCVLLLDELDGVGDRRTFDERHRDYSTQVVNGLLEMLDGAAGRAGVLVVGCTNNAARIDPAILRSGRLDRVLRVPLPDAAALEAALRVHLRGDLAGADLGPVAEAAHRRGATGADVERWCRGARSAARRAGRAVELADLSGEVGWAPPPSPEEVRRAAVHEAGHAVAALALRPGALVEARLWDGAGGPGRGRFDPRTEWAPGAFGEGSAGLTPTALRVFLLAVLSGRAAEEAVLGEACGGAGGGRDSDLARATVAATVCCASLGVGPEAPLPWRPAPSAEAALALLQADPVVHAEVRRLLAEADDAARRFARANRGAIERVAAALEAAGSLDAEAVVRAAAGGAPEAGAGPPP